MNKIIKLTLVFTVGTLLLAFMTPPQQEYYNLRIYHFKTDAQEKAIDSYLKLTLLPALHNSGIANVGVFKPIDLDTADRKIYILIPHKSLDRIHAILEEIETDKKSNQTGKEYFSAVYSNPPYQRMESIFLKAFSHQPVMQTPKLKGPREERVYELRSYEGHTEKIFRNKVHMFNEGGEVALFNRLGFNAVFYGEVLAGTRMPNLMYMTTFENKASRDEHWKSFGSDSEWKRLSSLPEYQNNVSKIDIHFLRPTDYSDY